MYSSLGAPALTPSPSEWKEDDEDAEDKQQWEDDWDDDEVDDDFSKQLRAELEKTGAQPQAMST